MVFSIGLETFVDYIPVNVCEKRFNVFWAFSGFIVEQECMLPYIHYEHWIESRHIANFVQCYPVIGQTPAFWILKADRPAHAAHFADTYKVGFPDIVAAEARLGRFIEVRLLAWITRSCFSHVSKVILMQHHAVVFEPETAGEF